MPASAGFVHGRSETLGAITATSTGSTITAGAANTKGSWVELGQSTFGYDFINLVVSQTNTSDKLIDIGVSQDTGIYAAFTPIASNLRLSGRKRSDDGRGYALPIRVRAGAYIGVRMQASTASHTAICTLIGTSTGMKGSNGYSRCVPLFTDATSRGPAVDPGGTANTKGAWTELVAATDVSVDAIFLVVGPNADVTRVSTATALIDIGVGSAGNEYPLLENISYRYTATSDAPLPDAFGPCPIAIPIGSRIVARSQCTDIAAGDRTWDCSLYGFVP